jgi:hypothetical protein
VSRTEISRGAIDRPQANVNTTPARKHLQPAHARGPEPLSLHIRIRTYELEGCCVFRRLLNLVLCLQNIFHIGVDRSGDFSTALPKSSPKIFTHVSAYRHSYTSRAQLPRTSYYAVISSVRMADPALIDAGNRWQIVTPDDRGGVLYIVVFLSLTYTSITFIARCFIKWRVLGLDDAATCAAQVSESYALPTELN